MLEPTEMPSDPTTERGFATLAASEQIVPFTPDEAVLAVSSAQDVVAAGSPTLIVATEATDHVPAVGTQRHIMSCVPRIVHGFRSADVGTQMIALNKTAARPAEEFLPSF